MRSRAEEIEEGARKLVRKHPEVWELFLKFTAQLIKAGWKNYGAKSVIERIRWHHAVESGEYFKINNNYTAVFVRWFDIEFPEYEGFFRTRHRTSKHRMAKGRPDLPRT